MKQKEFPRGRDDRAPKSRSERMGTPLRARCAIFEGGATCARRSTRPSAAPVRSAIQCRTPSCLLPQRRTFYHNPRRHARGSSDKPDRRCVSRVLATQSARVVRNSDRDRMSSDGLKSGMATPSHEQTRILSEIAYAKLSRRPVDPEVKRKTPTTTLQSSGRCRMSDARRPSRRAESARRTASSRPLPRRTSRKSPSRDRPRRTSRARPRATSRRPPP